VIKKMLGLEKEEWNLIKPFTEEVCLEKGAFLFKENSEAEEIYFLKHGSVEILKTGHHLATLKSGDWIGEIAALTDTKKRTASVRAKEKSLFIKISLPHLKKSTQHRPDIYNKIISIISVSIASRLRSSSERTVLAFQKQLELAKMRIVMGQFLFYLLFAIACFFYLLEIISALHFNPKDSSMISTPLIILLGWFLYMIMKKSGYPASTYGLTWHNGKRAIAESLVATACLIAFFIALKWTVTHFVPAFQDKPLFGFKDLLNRHLSTTEWLFLGIGYPLLAPLQELMARGCLQGSLMKFLVGPRRILYSILLSNAFFSTLHLQISLEISLYAFICGCCWGWLYSRHQTLVGVSLSHMIFGTWAFIFLGGVT
jgi:CRP-like cAMP-binding protein